MVDHARAFDITAVVGFVCWLAVNGAAASGRLTFDVGSVAETVAVSSVLLAVFVLVPLVGSLADLGFRDGRRSVWYRTSAVLTPPAALCAFVSFVVPQGETAAALAVPWLLVTLCLSVFGVQRGLPNTLRPEELSVSAGLAYLPVAGVFLVAHRLGITGWFTETTVLLTAVHFHYAGCVLLVFMGVVGRAVGGGGGPRLYRWLLTPTLLGPAAVGLGIAFSPALETVSAVVFAVLVAALGLYSVAHSKRASEGVGGWLTAAASAAIVVSMSLVVARLWAPDTVALDLERMVVWHGLLNAVGFGLFGLVGWRVVDPAGRAPPLGMPVSRLRSRGSVGADYLEERGVVDDGSPTGMVDAFSVFDGPELGASDVHPEVSRFYERTGEYELDVSPSWSWGFRTGARLYGWFARRFEQMNLPVSERDTRRLSSSMVDVDDGADGRSGVRAWVREYDDTESAIYVAVYSTHRLDGTPYMNIAFPVPWTNVTSVLSVEHLEGEEGSVELSTTTGGDAGIYARTPLGPLRLPLDESIRVWPAGEEDEEENDALRAEHDMFLLGKRFLRLDYRIRRR